MPGPASTPTFDARLQRYLRGTAREGRDVERVGPLLATFDRGSDRLLLNHAIPDDDAGPSSGDVAALVAAYAARGRRGRVECLPTVAPRAEAALVRGGFTTEGRSPLMMVHRPVEHRPRLGPRPRRPLTGRPRHHPV